MSKLTDLIAESTALALTAAEEASRFGVRTIDLEHVLLALVISDRPAGELLRGMGVTLDAARSAVAAQHGEHLAALGMETDLPGDGRIRFHEQNGYDYTDRAMKVMSQAGGWKRAGDSLEVLRELLDEPSGTTTALLARLGIDPAAVRERIDAAAPEPPSTQRKDPLSRTQTVFVPAAPERVWALVSDPERLPEWEVNLQSIEPDVDRWSARTRTVSPDGRVHRIRDRQRRQTAEIVERSGMRVAWRFRFPDDPRANTRLVEVSLSPSGDGTSASVTATWERAARPPRGPRRLIAPIVRVAVRPVLRFLLAIQASTLAAGISRPFRDG